MASCSTSSSNTSGISFCKGDSVIRSISLSSPTYQFTLTTTGVTTMPTIGDEYLQGTTQLYVVAVSGNSITFASSQETDTLTSTGSITRVTGSGDSTIAYTAKSSSLRLNLTGATVKFLIVKDLALPATGDNLVLASSTLTISSATNGLVSIFLAPATTAALPVGSFKGVIQVSYSTTIVNESLDSQYIPINISHNKIA